MRVLTLLLWVLSLGIIENSFGQSVNFEDGFEDGDYSHNPVWSGDTDLFVIGGNTQNRLLQLSGISEQPAHLSTITAKNTGIWEFYVEFDGFEPSASNRAEIFLMSDRADLKGAVNGYAVRAGESGDDVFRVVRYDQGSASTILSDTTVISGSGGGYRIKINRDSDGQWDMQVGRGYSGKLYDSGATVLDNTHISATHFGVLVNYTSSRSDKFLFDFKIDLPPFAVANAVLSGRRSIDVTFNRPGDQSTVEPGDFSLDHGVGSPAWVTFPSPAAVRLQFDSELPSNRYLLSLDGIQDWSGLPIQSEPEEITVYGDYAEGAVQITEFLYDPSDGSAEYIELQNTGDQYLNLANWIVGDQTGPETFGSDTVEVPPNGFLVVSADTASLSAIYGHRNYFQFSGLPSFNNSGDRIYLKSGSGRLVDSLSYSPDWGGEKVALERRSLATSAAYKENWGPSPGALNGTPGTANQIAADATPPKLTHLDISSDRSLSVGFDERLDPGTATHIPHYRITNASVSELTMTAADSVEITLSSPLQNAGRYTLELFGIEDIFGNALVTSDTSFTHYKISAVDSGDVFINEFMFDPPDGSSEYIELFNSTTKSLDVRGWSLNDNRGNRHPISSRHKIFPPGTYLVIAPDQTILKDAPGASLVTMNSRFPSLNNSGDNIVLRDSSGILLDSLQYASEWGLGAVPLERRTHRVSGFYAGNWGASSNPTGTPGSVNTVQKDQSPPALEKLRIKSSSELELSFSEQVSTESATQITNFEVSPHIPIEAITSDGHHITLHLNDRLLSGRTYRVTASNLANIFGNVLRQAFKATEYLEIDRSRPGDVVINEILYHRLPKEGYEFVEILNRSEKNFDLSNWAIGDAAGPTVIKNGIVLRAHEYLVISANSNFSGSRENIVHLSDFSSLNDDGDAVYLRNSRGVTIDSLHYFSSWGGDTAGTSLERIDPRAASNDASNWQSSSTSEGHSAGEKNTGYRHDVRPPGVIFSKKQAGGEIEVQFNEFIQLTDKLKFLSGGRPLKIASYDSTDANIVVLNSLPQGLMKTSLEILNLTDVSGNTAHVSRIPIAQPVKPSDLVLNEIMYDPLQRTGDEENDQSEYIEVRNTRNYALSLEGLVLHGPGDENGNPSIMKPATSAAKWIAPRGFALFYPDHRVLFENSRIAEFFKLKTRASHHLMRFDRAGLGLGASGDAIYLADSTGTTIDSVFYDASWQNPNLTAHSGIALERISPRGPSNQDFNWGSSVHTRGGTPAKENSLYQHNVEFPGKPGISLAPNPFSPDNDGYEDRLFINYKLNEPDYLLRVQVYDRYGRRVGELANGKPAGFEGGVIWDGRKTDGSRNRIGIYIIVFEAYDSASGKDLAFKKTAVLARKLH